MKKVILLTKEEGETPLECLGRFRSKNKKYKDVKMTYAGRLDPMASGLMLVLAGEEVKKKEKYLKLGKVYEFEILFGFSTDTYDILGKIQHSHILKNVGMLEEKIKSNLKYFRGKFLQKYPLYSSKTIKHARAGNLVDAPEREVHVKSFKLLKIRKVEAKKILENVEKRIMRVKGDFRQEEILSLWRKYLHTSMVIYVIANFKINCSSGTYVRSIAHNLGKRVGIPALAYSIKRTKVGKWSKI